MMTSDIEDPKMARSSSPSHTFGRRTPSALQIFGSADASASPETSSKVASSSRTALDGRRSGSHDAQVSSSRPKSFLHVPARIATTRSQQPGNTDFDSTEDSQLHESSVEADISRSGYGVGERGGFNSTSLMSSGRNPSLEANRVSFLLDRQDLTPPPPSLPTPPRLATPTGPTRPFASSSSPPRSRDDRRLSEFIQVYRHNREEQARRAGTAEHRKSMGSDSVRQTSVAMSLPAYLSGVGLGLSESADSHTGLGQDDQRRSSRALHLEQTTQAVGIEPRPVRSVANRGEPRIYSRRNSVWISDLSKEAATEVAWEQKRLSKVYVSAADALQPRLPVGRNQRRSLLLSSGHHRSYSAVLPLEATKRQKTTLWCRKAVLPYRLLVPVLVSLFFDFNALFVLGQVALFPTTTPQSGNEATWWIAFGIYALAAVSSPLMVLAKTYRAFARQHQQTTVLALPTYLSFYERLVLQSSSGRMHRFTVMVDRSASRGQRITEIAWRWSQLWPQTIWNAPRSTIAVVLLVTISPYTGTVPAALGLQRDPFFFDEASGVLSNYGFIVLLANAAWLTLGMLIIGGAWLLSLILKHRSAIHKEPFLTGDYLSPAERLAQGLRPSDSSHSTNDRSAPLWQLNTLDRIRLVLLQHGEALLSEKDTARPPPDQDGLTVSVEAIPSSPFQVLYESFEAAGGALSPLATRRVAGKASDNFSPSTLAPDTPATVFPLSPLRERVAHTLAPASLASPPGHAFLSDAGKKSQSGPGPDASTPNVSTEALLSAQEVPGAMAPQPIRTSSGPSWMQPENQKASRVVIVTRSDDPHFSSDSESDRGPSPPYDYKGAGADVVTTSLAKGTSRRPSLESISSEDSEEQRLWSTFPEQSRRHPPGLIALELQEGQRPERRSLEQPRSGMELEQSRGDGASLWRGWSSADAGYVSRQARPAREQQGRRTAVVPMPPRRSSLDASPPSSRNPTTYLGPLPVQGRRRDPVLPILSSIDEERLSMLTPSGSGGTSTTLAGWTAAAENDLGESTDRDREGTSGEWEDEGSWESKR